MRRSRSFGLRSEESFFGRGGVAALASDQKRAFLGFVFGVLA